VKEFWEEQHRAGNRYWLTGSNPMRVLQQHRLEMPQGKVVLDIGVGEGVFSRACARAKNTVIACDISETALHKVRLIARTFLVNDLVSAPPVDLAVCHLVFQHCSDAMVKHILHSVTLKRSGLLSFQFAFLKQSSVSVEAHKEAGHLVFRSLERMRELVAQARLKTVWVSVPTLYDWEDAQIGWHILHCRSRRG
jgi:precorrin-6B methylase 2